jgi:sugar-specific transcriptional regulator TrmB
LSLLVKGIATAGEIAELSRVPRSRTYDVLENLEKKGFAIVKIGKPVKYIGIKPKIILEKLKKNVKEDADERIQSLSKIKITEEFQKLEQMYNEGITPVKKEDLSAALTGRSNISNYLREIIKETEKELIVCTNAEELKLKLKLFKQTFDLLNREKIKIKVALSGDERIIKQLEAILKVKIKPTKINAKFFIIDRKEILFYLTDNPEKEEIAIWLNSELFSNAFANLFDKTLD